MKPAAYILPYRLSEKLVGSFLAALIIFYLIFHVISGEHGLYALLKEQRKLELLKAELIEVTAQRKEMEHRVHLLSSSSLDVDMLDEQARAVLDDAATDEVVIPVK